MSTVQTTACQFMLCVRAAHPENPEDHALLLSPAEQRELIWLNTEIAINEEALAEKLGKKEEGEVSGDELEWLERNIKTIEEELADLYDDRQSLVRKQRRAEEMKGL